MLILLPFLCQLIPKIEIIRNTSSNLIMLSILLKNFSSPPLTCIFTLVDWKELFQATAALMRTQHEGCSCLRHFIHVYTSLRTQRCARTYGHRCHFANYAFHPQKQGRDRCFREGSQDGSSWLMAGSSLARRQRGPGSDLPNIPFVCCRSADVTT